MNGFATARLADIAKVGAGNPAPQDKALFEGGTYPFFRTADVGRVKVGELSNAQDHLNERGIKKLTLHRAGTVLIPKSGASTFLDHRVIMAVDGYVSSHLATLWADETKLDRRYLYWVMQTVAAREVSTDTSYPTLSLGQIGEIRIPLPPLEDQRQIVAVLDEAFAAIAIATANAEKNLANVEGWFEKELSKCFEETTRQRPLGSIASLVRGPFGGSLKKNIFKPDGFAVYEQQHAINDQFEFVRYFVDEAKFAEMKRFAVRPGEIIMSCSGTIGKVALVPEDVRPGIINQALLKIAPSETCLGEYLLWYMRSAMFRTKIKQHSGGAALQNVASVGVLKAIDVPMADIGEQQARLQRIMALLEAAQELKTTYQRKLVSLGLLKQSLLRLAFTGDLAVREPLAA